jgi:hypothetical protein
MRKIIFLSLLLCLSAAVPLRNLEDVDLDLADYNQAVDYNHDDDVDYEHDGEDIQYTDDADYTDEDDSEQDYDENSDIDDGIENDTQNKYLIGHSHISSLLNKKYNLLMDSYMRDILEAYWLMNTPKFKYNNAYHNRNVKFGDKIQKVRRVSLSHDSNKNTINIYLPKYTLTVEFTKKYNDEKFTHHHHSHGSLETKPASQTTIPQSTVASATTLGRETTIPQTTAASTTTLGRETTIPQTTSASATTTLGRENTIPQTTSASATTLGRDTTTPQTTTAASTTSEPQTSLPRPTTTFATIPMSTHSSTLPLATTSVAQTEEINRRFRQLLGQWYLAATTSEDYARFAWRECVVITNFRHGRQFFMKFSENFGNQTYSMKDHKIDSIDHTNYRFSMDGKQFVYSLTQIKVGDKSPRFLHIQNQNDKNENYLYTEDYPVKNTKIAKDILEKLGVGNLMPIDTNCYFD